MRINGINSTLSSVILFLSPAVSGAVLSAASLEATLFLDVFTALIGVGITGTIYIRPYAKKIQDRNSCLEEMKAGFL